MRKEDRRKRRKTKIKIYIILSLLLLVALTAFVVIKVFTVEKVVVEGNVLYSNRQIEEMILNDEYSWNSLYVNLKYHFTEMGEIPFVDEMEISLDDPHTIHVKVYEKGILGYLYIPILGQNAYFDKDGFVVETSKEKIEDVPKVTGVKCNEVILYEQLALEDPLILRELLNLTQTLKKYDLLPSEIRFDDSKGAVLTYEEIRVVVGSDENLSQKIIRLSYILPQLKGMSGTLHLENWTEENTDIIFDKDVKLEGNEE